MDTAASELGNNRPAAAHPIWRPHVDRPLIPDLKCKKRAEPKIGQGYINGCVPRRPCPILFPAQESI